MIIAINIAYISSKIITKIRVALKQGAQPKLMTYFSLSLFPKHTDKNNYLSDKIIFSSSAYKNNQFYSHKIVTIMTLE